MSIAKQIMRWRRSRGHTQAQLADAAGLTRAYISRLESGHADPSMSSVTRIAEALGLGLGQLLEGQPEQTPLDRDALDGLARAALWPGSKEALKHPETRILSQLVRERRQIMGLRTDRTHNYSVAPPAPGHHAARWLRVALGETQWTALMDRIDKLMSLVAARQAPFESQ
jgi:transcriptional regulator with XRE-family HTH domain